MLLFIYVLVLILLLFPFLVSKKNKIFQNAHENTIEITQAENSIHFEFSCCVVVSVQIFSLINLKMMIYLNENLSLEIPKHIAGVSL